jgi:hypothetical protein
MPAPLRGFAISDLQIGYEEQVDDVGRVVSLINDNSSAAGGNGHEFAVLHRYLAAIREMDNEWFEGCRIV